MTAVAVVPARRLRRAAHAEFGAVEYSLSNGKLTVELVTPIAVS